MHTGLLCTNRGDVTWTFLGRTCCALSVGASTCTARELASTSLDEREREREVFIGRARTRCILHGNCLVKVLRGLKLVPSRASPSHLLCGRSNRPSNGVRFYADSRFIRFHYLSYIRIYASCHTIFKRFLPSRGVLYILLRNNWIVFFFFFFIQIILEQCSTVKFFSRINRSEMRWLSTNGGLVANEM